VQGVVVVVAEEEEEEEAKEYRKTPCKERFHLTISPANRRCLLR
jgi:hypothetical protein